MIKEISAFLRKPYPIIRSENIWWIRCFAFSMFVFLFLFLFQPFGLSQVQNNLSILVGGYALICFTIMVLLDIGIPKIYPAFFRESSWSIGKEIYWTLLNIILIGIANSFYSSCIGFFQFNLLMIARFTFYVIGVAIFPISIFVLLRQSRLQNKFFHESEIINEVITIHALQPASEYQFSDTVSIPSQNINENFSLAVFDLLFIRAAENYVEINFISQNKPSRKLIRNTMKEMENCLKAYPQLLRCHKSFLVNLDKVISSSGNAQGLKLHLNGIEESIPVARHLIKTIREHISIHP